MASVEAAIQQDTAHVAAVGSVTRGRRAKWLRRSGSKSRGFVYETVEGRRVTDEAVLERVKSLVIPPAWREVRVSPGPRSSLQVIGLDGEGRVQRIYHPSFIARQRRRKYEKIERFGEALPALRKKTNEDIAREGLGKERVLAVVVRLINDLYFRLGSEESVKRYRTYGVTTLRNRHVEIRDGGELVFNFVGKHHVRHRRILVDEELAALLQEIKAIGGAKLFEYIGEDGKIYAVRPRDVNDYIKAATSQEFSAKDFRTWGGTLLAAIELAEEGHPEDKQQAKSNAVKAVRRVAERLGNTPAVCRDCYIHPSVLESYLEGKLLEEFRPRSQRRIKRQQPEYDPEELALLKMFNLRKNGS
ncbi:MAG: DNA topoisomerase IB [Acidobacteria bacterium]|nr:DNA topoisomerase IB [Acidobacteriota bacterium]